VSCRNLQLAAGRPPKQRRATYIRVDEEIRRRKLNFGMEYGGIFAHVFPHPSSSVLVQDVIEKYLDNVSVLVMGAEIAKSVDTVE
jgi:hypothetical protein